MDNEKILELMTKMYAGLKGSQEKMYAEMQQGFKSVGERFNSVDERLSTLEKTVIKIEIDHGAKLSALFDGYIQNSEKLDRIELEVAKHDEFIMKRIK